MTEPLDPAEVEAVAGSFRLSAAVVALASLGIPDLLEPSPADAVELAARSGCDVASLRRLLRFAAASGVLDEVGTDRFAQTGFSRRLSGGAPDSCRDMVLGWTALPAMYEAFGDLPSAVRTGVSGIRARHGTSFHELLERDRRQATLYAAAMESTVGGFDAVLDAWDFSAVGTVVDVGGGQGAFLARLIQRHAMPRGVLFDLPAVVAGAPARLERLGVTGRIDVVGGDMLAAVPAGGDAYCLITVLRCFDEADASRILQRCHAAMATHARLIVVDMLVPDGPATLPTARTDLMAWLVYGGGDRTEAQWRGLLGGSGFEVRRIVGLDDPYAIIEAAPAG